MGAFVAVGATIFNNATFDQCVRAPFFALGVLPVAPAAAVLFPSRITPLVSALQNNRLSAIHVALMPLSYGAMPAPLDGRCSISCGAADPAESLARERHAVAGTVSMSNAGLGRCCPLNLPITTLEPPVRTYYDES